MTSTLNPYITFDGTAEEAMTFYQAALGGDLDVNRFGEFGAPEGVDQQGIMHARLSTPAGFTLMASDAAPGQPAGTSDHISVSLSGDDEAEMRGYWDKLSDGGEETMPLEKQVWGDIFGMCKDKFGVHWMVNITGSDQG